MTTKPRRVIGYVRLSRAAVDSTSIDKQREILTKTCEARGWVLVDIVEDPDVSATSSRLDRPGLNEVRARVADGEADGVLVWRLDRIARSVVDFGTLLDDGLDVVSATEPLDTGTPMGRAMAEILQVFAALEAKTTGERLKATKAYLRGLGRWTGGPRPYGYTPVPSPDGIGKVLEPVPDEARVVRRIVEEVADGRTTYAVARGLNADGIPAAKGGEWSAHTVRNLVRAGHILGRVMVAASPGKRERRPLLDSEGVPLEVWPALVDLATAERARAATESSGGGRGGSRRVRATRLLSGRLSCPCGASLVVRNRRGVPYYGCSAMHRGKAHDGTGVLVEAERVEEEITERFLALHGHMTVIERVTRSTAVPGLAEVDRELAEAGARVPLTSPADLPALFDLIGTLSARREALEASRPSTPEVEEVDTGETFGERWHRLHDVDARRRLLTLAGITATIRPARQRGVWDPSRVEIDAPEPDYLAGQLD